MESYTCNNVAEVIGIIEDEPVLNHEIYGEKFYTFTLRIPRLSEINDYIRIMISDRLLANFPLAVGDAVEINGQFRSYNSYENGDSRLILTVFAKDIKAPDETTTKNPNTLFLNGYICKPPIYRTTPFGREITDMLLAVNRTYNKSDYIPIIAWGRNARYCKNFEVGSHIKVWGRIQSRVYQKRISEEETIQKVAYEISVNKLELVRDENPAKMPEY